MPRNDAAHPSYINHHLKSEVSITLDCRLCSTHYTINITNQELFEKHLCNQSSHYDKYRRFPLQREAIIVRWISYKIVRFSDKSTKFGTEVEDHLSNKSGYWASADYAPFDRFRPLNRTNKILMFNYTINKGPLLKFTCTLHSKHNRAIKYLILQSVILNFN